MRMFIILVLIAFCLGLGPPVAQADNFTITSYAAIIPSLTSGHAPNLGAAGLIPSDRHDFAVGIYYDAFTSTMCGKPARSPVIQTQSVIVSRSNKCLFVDSNDDAIILTATASTTAGHIYYGSYGLVRSSGRHDETATFKAYNPRDWRHDHLREIFSLNEGVTRAA